ncbi:hypothetical protein BDA96_08G044900 [Sorghum bicolor]|uniref:RNA helicase n=2 Tax=Sorghum bicolor TaxID=4558 RepID=A0A921U613_SORBI|nr:DEAD-box ATP-dependent RNA helicase 10 [Sorghum bicolor]KAG0520107.1 hypothetical protein BDA96_08G044900 [Sorghum bicolor]KXG22990.1 hypothetical protein SORBI_3008G041300 [Sorghum bicolor]|eukprot:XP_021301489.1 DEAD-box ATP-dependent RNA helicase 10 [Sorghum bicolor]
MIAASGGDAQVTAHRVSTFADLGVCSELVNACGTLGWKQPTKIQSEAIPYALKGMDLIALAQTGSGKTAAFALPILQALLEHRRPFFACVLSPTRELAIQIAEQFEALGSAIGLVCSVLVGGVDRMQQVISLARHPHIIVATPGRLLDHLTDTKGFSLNKIKYLVLDEADVLLDMEFEKSLNDILKVIPKERRTFLFSATMTDKVKKLQRACLRNPVKLKVSCKYSTVDTLREEFYLVPANDKDCCLVYVLNKIPGSMIMIFTETCYSSRLLALMLRNLGFEAIFINGKMSQDKRLGALNRFKSKGCNIITCTDVASRGLDIQGVDVVINYDIPSLKSYVHRVGRTARAGQSGYALSLVNQYEVLRFKYIEKLLGKEISKSEVDECELKILKECVCDSKRIALKVKGDGCKRPRSMQDDEDGMEGHDPFCSRRSSGMSINRSRRR